MEILYKLNFFSLLSGHLTASFEPTAFGWIVYLHILQSRCTLSWLLAFFSLSLCAPVLSLAGVLPVVTAGVHQLRQKTGLALPMPWGHCSLPSHFRMLFSPQDWVVYTQAWVGLGYLVLNYLK